MMSPSGKTKDPLKQTTTLKNNLYKSIELIEEKATVASVDYFERRLDDKRRLTIPSELREEFISGVVLTRGFGHYLHLYPKVIWDQEVETALSASDSILDEKTADMNVQFRRGKTEAELDQKQGRITIEQHLLEYAGIDRDIEAVRAGKYWRVMAP
jgi:MraZ protein